MVLFTVALTCNKGEWNKQRFMGISCRLFIQQYSIDYLVMCLDRIIFTSKMATLERYKHIKAFPKIILMTRYLQILLNIRSVESLPKVMLLFIF